VERAEKHLRTENALKTGSSWAWAPADRGMWSRLVWKAGRACSFHPGQKTDRATLAVLCGKPANTALLSARAVLVHTHSPLHSHSHSHSHPHPHSHSLTHLNAHSSVPLDADRVRLRPIRPEQRKNDGRQEQSGGGRGYKGGRAANRCPGCHPSAAQCQSLAWRWRGTNRLPALSPPSHHLPPTRPQAPLPLQLKNQKRDLSQIFAS